MSKRAYSWIASGLSMGIFGVATTVVFAVAPTVINRQLLPRFLEKYAEHQEKKKKRK